MELAILLLVLGAGFAFLGGDDDAAEAETGQRDSNRLDVEGSETGDLLEAVEASVVRAGEGDDTIVGSDGDDDIYGEDGDDSILGEAGRDFLSGGDGEDTVLGGAGDDTLRGLDDDDQLLAEAGDDVVFGGAGNDFIDGGLGNDRLDGGAGNDTIIDFNGSGTLNGGTGADFLDAVAEPLYSEPGQSSTVSGGFGNDFIRGDDGDVLTGGPGDDDFELYTNGALDPVTITDFDPAEEVVDIFADLPADVIAMGASTISVVISPDGSDLHLVLDMPDGNESIVAVLQGLGGLPPTTIMGQLTVRAA